MRNGGTAFVTTGGTAQVISICDPGEAAIGAGWASSSGNVYVRNSYQDSNNTQRWLLDVTNEGNGTDFQAYVVCLATQQP